MKQTSGNIHRTSIRVIVTALIAGLLVVWGPQFVHGAAGFREFASRELESNSLLVSFTGTASEIGTIPTSLVSAMQGQPADSATVARLAKLGQPIGIAAMIQDRLLDQQLETRSVFHPERLLQNFVVVFYDSSESAARMLDSLRKDPAVLYAGANHIAEPSWWPSWEPYYSNGYPNELDYQWGMLALRTYEAWDIAIGWGYVGVVDNGIAPLHEEFVASFAKQMATNHTVPIGDPQRSNVDEESVPALNGSKGHGTHVAGIIAAKSWNQVGGAGICPECTLLVQKWVTFSPSPPNPPDRGGTKSDTVNGLYQAVVNGSQVVNFSGGAPLESEFQCGQQPSDPWCLVADLARRRQVNLVAASGNSGAATLQMPAAINEYLPVGGLSVFASSMANNFLYWKPWAGSRYSAADPTRVVLAPAQNVVSSFYPNMNWSPTCGIAVHGSFQSSLYGNCTGTSMAAPHVSGMLAVMRSINPLATDVDARQVLMNSTSVPNFSIWPYSDPVYYTDFDKEIARWGRGVPNMRTAVDAMAAGNPTRLTPLFSMYGTGPEDYFYTAVPQMAMAATQGKVLPNSGTLWWDLYSFVGSPIHEYPNLPESFGHTPKAQMWVFTTRANPKSPANSLVALYRFSWRCTSGCQNPNKVDHIYTTYVSEFGTLLGLGYLYDGIEGFIYPPDGPQYPGTEAIYRSYHPTRLDYAVYPAGLYGSMMFEGYSAYLVHLGWAYPNSGPRPVIQ